MPLTKHLVEAFRFKMHNFCYGYACRLHSSGKEVGVCRTCPYAFPRSSISNRPSLSCTPSFFTTTTSSPPSTCTQFHSHSALQTQALYIAYKQTSSTGGRINYNYTERRQRFGNISGFSVVNFKSHPYFKIM